MKLFLLFLLSLLLSSCAKEDSVTPYAEVPELYLYDCTAQTLTRVTTSGPYLAATFCRGGEGILSVATTSEGQFLMFHVQLSDARKALAVAHIVPSGNIGPGLQRKFLADSAGEFTYYCADSYIGADPYLLRMSRDIYQLSNLTGTVRNLTNNSTALVGSISLSDDDSQILFDQIDTSTSKCSLVLLDLVSGSRRVLAQSDSTLFLAPQFVHTSRNILFLERSRLSASADVVSLSLLDTSNRETVGTSSYVSLNNFPSLSQDNLYPNRSLDLQCQVLDISSHSTISFAGPVLDNEFFISRDGHRAFISGFRGTRQLTICDIAAEQSNTVTLSDPELREYHICDVNSDGSKVLILGTRRFASATGSAF